MSGFKTHNKWGIASALLYGVGSYVYTGNLKLSAISMVAILFGSLAPDVDTGSIPSRIFAWMGIALAAFFIVADKDRWAAIVGIIYMSFSSLKHRGLTHSMLLIVACVVAGMAASFGKIHPNYFYLAPFGFGLFIHSFIVDK